MKIIIKYLCCICLLTCGYESYSQVTVYCPPCRPISGCGQCWELQQNADACSQSTTRMIKSGEQKQVLELELGLSIYPNPSPNRNFYIKNEKGSQGLVRLINHGKLITQFRLNGEKRYQVTQLANMPSGMYHLVFTSDEGKVERHKLLIH